ncbi:TPA: DUF1360 domain-containing protein [Kluyvera intermedia]|uniref:DUF1360 domain-containing protein n=2 Tax=Enterobacteriaceae TaxID=543 RepID=A0AAC8QSX3_9ENTR|nr:hypothetical protein [Phytobacter ursingii]HAT2205259.1 DUF1360 domain-containing protein [Kluyvera intermedia]AKL14207.1 hypothetical protein AB182_24295 [Phytobacter ursingii]HAT2515986.1 DUF1360 domain-containing protein [Kluyvera intermedia]HAT2603670.1 DUF1360 domain-containing protein [Kluyvera intermedia]HAT2680565.1 DUF1360 domain-containing protein [Kluyvera intermedia]
MISTLMTELTTCLMIALAASSISMTVTQTELFAAFREWTTKKNAMLGHLFHCFYCLSHWVVFGGMLVYRPALLQSGFALIDWVMTAFITITLTTLINGLMFKVFQAAVSTHVMKFEAQKTLQSDK